MVWIPLVIVYWGLAFVIGSAIPSVGTLSGLVAAVAIFQFSYTFPPVLLLGYMMKVDAMKYDEPFTSPGVAPRQHDSWRSFVSSRFSRQARNFSSMRGTKIRCPDFFRHRYVVSLAPWCFRRRFKAFSLQVSSQSIGLLARE